MKRRSREMAKEVIEEVNKLENLKGIDFIIDTKKNKIKQNTLHHILQIESKNNIYFSITVALCEFLAMKIFSILI